MYPPGVTVEPVAPSALSLSVEVRNAGDEVVEAYVSRVAASASAPIRSLVGFSRITLKAGEKRMVSFTLTSEQFSVIDDHGRRIVEPGEVSITVGGKQPWFKGHTDAPTTNVISAHLTITGKTIELEQK